jgi:beta-1,2-mannobiose phosphorylase / 1,2-beta-oligomannan phosphorylase
MTDVVLTRHPANPILGAVPEHDWERGSVLNPSVLADGDRIRLVYRATMGDSPASPDTYVSSVGYAESTDGVHFDRLATPVLAPTERYEAGLGCEDGRLCRVEGDSRYFLYYSAIAARQGDLGVRIALATSTDCRSWQKHGVVGPPCTSKAACLFPERVGGQYLWLYTFMADTPVSTIMLARADSIDEVLAPPPGSIESNVAHFERNAVIRPPHGVRRGAEVGAVPIRVRSGWLLIYCGANTADHDEWTIDAALLDAEDPSRVLATLPAPLLRPETETDRTGIVANVTFPSGALIRGDELWVYYGSGDADCSLATCPLEPLLQALEQRIG